MDYLAYSLILGQAHVLMLHQVQGHIRLDRIWTTTLDRSVLRSLYTNYYVLTLQPEQILGVFLCAWDFYWLILFKKIQLWKFSLFFSKTTVQSSGPCMRLVGTCKKIFSKLLLLINIVLIIPKQVWQDWVQTLHN